MFIADFSGLVQMHESVSKHLTMNAVIPVGALRQCFYYCAWYAAEACLQGSFVRNKRLYMLRHFCF